jgi:hypothetical protein
VSIGAIPYCACRTYGNARILSFILIRTANRKILIKGALWVIAQGGVVGLLDNGTEVVLRREAGRVVAYLNGEKLGVTEYVSLPTFVERLLAGWGQPAATRRVTVIASGREAEEILSTPGATLRAVENGKATIAVPL